MEGSLKVIIMMDIFVVTVWKLMRMVIFILVTSKMVLKEVMGLTIHLQQNKSTKVKFFIFQALGKMIYLMVKVIITIMKQHMKDSFLMV